MENEIMSFRKVNLIKEIKLRRWLKASFYDIFNFASFPDSKLWVQM